MSDALTNVVGDVGLEILDHSATNLLDELSELPLGRILIRAYIPADQATDFRVDLTQVPSAVLHPAVPLSNEWQSQWKQFFRALRIGQHLVIRPPWETVDDPSPADINVVIDPGMAFGTGMHETTRLCLQALEQLIGVDDRVLDVGCGSGVLSIACAKIGAGKVVAIDVDPPAIEATIENAAVNHVSSRIDVSDRLLKHVDGTFDMVLANILSSVLVDLRQQLFERLRPDGHLLLSGILTDEADHVSDHFTSLGLELAGHFSEGEWACLHLRRA